MSTGRIVALITGCLLLLPAMGLLLAGGGVGLAALAEDDDGYLSSPAQQLATDGVALTVEDLELVIEPGTPDRVLEALDVDVRLDVTPDGQQAVFAGVGPADEVAAYLEGVPHDEVVAVDGRGVRYEPRPGGASAAPPQEQPF